MKLEDMWPMYNPCVQWVHSVVNSTYLSYQNKHGIESIQGFQRIIYLYIILSTKTVTKITWDKCLSLIYNVKKVIYPSNWNSKKCQISRHEHEHEKFSDMRHIIPFYMLGL